MEYIDSYLKLNEQLSLLDSCAEFDSINIYKKQFNSEYYKILPGNSQYYCDIHKQEFQNSISFFNDIGTIQDDVRVKDYFVEENRDFEYYVFKPIDIDKSKKVVFLFHGFNEKSWDKYLTWAKTICEKTKSAVVLFPIAFHMKRAPMKWSEKRSMFKLSEKRKERFPNIINSSLSNVAISMRLHAMPQRFIWSGIQTYYDIINFINDCKEGNNELIDKDFSFDIFAYSIGGFLALILKLTNYKDYFNDSKVCLFCSGAVFNRLSPVSKMILDSEANVALYSYLVEHFDSFLKKDNLLRHYMDDDHLEGKVFHSMLDYMKMREFREELFRKEEDNIYAISLKKDTVIPSIEILNTLKGAYRDINIKVEELDFDYVYTHENPFPIKRVDQKLVSDSHKRVFDKVCDFFK